jgi:hypothetical protein
MIGPYAPTNCDLFLSLGAAASLRGLGAAPTGPLLQGRSYESSIESPEIP